jgi:FKBP-type peptidyl-prolyl cis-trans isomerase 2
MFSIILFAGCTGAVPNDINSAADTNGINDVNSFNDSNGRSVNNLDQFVKIKTGDTVSVDYNGRFEDGSVFDSSMGREPLTFQVGAGNMIKGFDDAVIGMKVGETKTVTLPPELAYGQIDPNKIVDIDRNLFSKIPSIEVGTMVTFQSGMRGRVEKFNDQNVTMNFNSEMAGKTLVFEITVVSINK